MTSPPQKHAALAIIATRGPRRSIHLPNTAAESPSMISAIE